MNIRTLEYDQPEWDTPPPPDAGEVASVEFHTRITLAPDFHVQVCQACDEPVKINQDHVLVMIRVFH